MAAVDTIQQSIAELADLFHVRMAELQQNLDRAGPNNPSISSVASDFSAFKSFVLKALDTLQKQVELVAQQADDIEMRSRRKMLILHGVKNSAAGSEDTAKLVVDTLKTIKSGVSAADVSRCHRLGKPQGSKPRPILVKFRDISVRDEIWFGKVALKGSGVTMGEFLTKPRHALFAAARERFGVRRSWSWNGNVYVLDADGVRRRVGSLAQLKTLTVPPAAPAASISVVDSSDAAESTEESVPEATMPSEKESRRPRRVPKPQS